MTTVSYAISKDIPVVAESDVIVVGGGPGGLGAAVMAARAGASVTLVERFGVMGGMASVGEVNPFMPNHANGICLDKPVYVEWVKRCATYLPDDLRPDFEPDDEISGQIRRTLSKDIAALAAEDLCLEAGVRILYHHDLVDVLVKDDRIEAGIFHSKSGFVAMKAHTWVDCTGDADLAARAGCTFEQGGPSGFCQPMTLCFKLSNVDWERMPKWDEIKARYEAAKARGEIDCPREDVLYFHYFDKDVVHFNTTRVIHKSGTNGVELSEAEILARKQMRQILPFLRKEIPGFEQARIHSMAQHIGIRETRRIKGRAYGTRADFESAAKYPDGIARVRYPIDIHNPDGTGTELIRMPEGDYYEIRYGSVVPVDICNLTVGGRPISVDHALHSSMRVMPPAVTVGQAAGLAAALSAKRNTTPAELDGTEVRKILQDMGA